MVRIPRRALVVAVLFTFFTVFDLTLSAQTFVLAPQPTAPQSAASPPTPDGKAFTDANKIPEPGKKIEALEKFLREFPESTRKTQAYDVVFTALVKNFPEDRKRILEYGEQIIEATPETFRSSGYSRVAARLVDAGILLDDAARLAEKGLERFEVEEKTRTSRSRATHLATLGRIRLKQGRAADGEEALKAAFAANPEMTAAAIGLAEVAEAKKDLTGALEHWTTAALTGRLSAEDRKRFEALYAKVNGSADGLEAALDTKYKATHMPPVQPQTYTPTPARSNRVVLAEVFTGASCGPCVAVDLAFDAAMERYTRKDLAVVMYHLHIPGPDPLTNKSTEERAKFYTVRGVPSFAVDGTVDPRGGGDRAQTRAAYDRILPQLDKALEAAPDAELRLDATLTGGVVKVKAFPSNMNAEGGAVKLQIALVEEMMTYSGENGVRFHPMVVRSLAGAASDGITVGRAAPAQIEWEFDLAKIGADIKTYLDDYEKNGARATGPFSRKPSTIGAAKLAIVAFLQDQQSKKVLQAAYVRLSPATTTSAGQ
jgi:tetratricopeptide (TPR) repeat protein